jgi:hypothetical protein
MRSWALPAVLICCLALAACGGENKRDLGPQNLPLTNGARVSAKVRVCDKGANAYCAEQLIVVGDDYATSADLLNAENAYLRKLGWTASRGNTGKQLAAQSPGNELRVTYDTAYNDLLAIDSGWIRRSAPYGRALSSTLFDRDSAIAVELLRGSS